MLLIGCLVGIGLCVLFGVIAWVVTHNVVGILLKDKGLRDAINEKALNKDKLGKDD